MENRTSTPENGKRPSAGAKRSGKQKNPPQIMPPQQVDLPLPKTTVEEMEAPPAELVRGHIRRSKD